MILPHGFIISYCRATTRNRRFMCGGSDMSDQRPDLHARRAKWPHAAVLTVCLAALAGAGLAHATAVFEGFVDSMRVICNEQPSASCAYAVKTFLDADGNGYVTQDEVVQARDDARDSMKSQESGLGPEERGIVAVALLVTQDTQIPVVFSNFDSNGDGGLDEDEMFADFNLDQRPFAELVSDPDAVDWQSFATRFGPAGILIIGLLPEKFR